MAESTACEIETIEVRRRTERRCIMGSARGLGSLPAFFRMAWLQRRLRALEYPSAQSFSLASTSPLAYVSPLCSCASSISDASDAGTALPGGAPRALFTSSTDATNQAQLCVPLCVGALCSAAYSLSCRSALSRKSGDLHPSLRVIPLHYSPQHRALETAQCYRAPRLDLLPY